MSKKFCPWPLRVEEEKETEGFLMFIRVRNRERNSNSAYSFIRQGYPFQIIDQITWKEACLFEICSLQASFLIL
jgi:hypothetical protein